MSLKSWRAEFYPVSAKNVSKKDALQHSLKKWEGLQVENLARHGCRIRNHCVGDYEGGAVNPINANSCALCTHYLAARNNIAGLCGGCPIVEQTKRCTVLAAPWSRFILNNDTEPMYKVLKEARTKEIMERYYDIPEYGSAILSGISTDDYGNVYEQVWRVPMWNRYLAASSAFGGLSKECDAEI